MQDSALIEKLSERVHEAWMAEKIRQGFADHPTWLPVSPALVTFTGAHPDTERLCRGDGTVTHVKRRNGGPDIAVSDGTLCDIPADKHHPDMLPYADLAEHVKEYDRATVRAVLSAIKDTGLTIVQADTPRHESAPGPGLTDWRRRRDSECLI